MTTASETSPAVVDAEPSYADLSTPAPSAPTDTAPAADVDQFDTGDAAPADEPEAEPGWTHPDPDKWEHQWLDFHGDRLAYRPPSPAAMTGFYLAQVGATFGKQLELINRLLSRHLSPDSFERVMDRSMEPDSGYGDMAFDELITAMSEATKEAAEAAAAEAETGK